MTYYSENRDRVLARDKARRDASPELRASINARTRTWNQANRYGGRLLSKLKYRAKRKGVPFTLTLADIPSVPDHCPVLGVKLLFTKEPAHPHAPSLDRIIPELGYVPGNVRFISNRANTLKSDGTAAEMRLVLADLESHHV
jgi:hypothetical protein